MINKIKIINDTYKLIKKYNKTSENLKNCYEKNNIIENYNNLFYNIDYNYD